MIGFATIFHASTIIALAGILSGAAVGIFSPLFVSGAETKRLRDQLAFQRWETDRQELRSILDALAADLAALPDVLLAIEAWLIFQHASTNEHDSEGAARAANERAQAMRELVAKQNSAVRGIERARLRLDDDGADLLALARTMVDHCRKAVVPWTTVSEANLERVSSELWKQYDAFVKATLAFTAAKVYSPR